MNTMNHSSTQNASDQEIPTVSPVIGEGSEAHRLVRVGTWTLTAWASGGGDEPLVRDLDLATRLGYERPRDIRKLIKDLGVAGKLNDINIRDERARGFGQRPSKEFWLTEAQALKVVAKSETAAADALLDEVIRVYVLARKGLLPQQAFPATVEGMAMALRPTIDQAIVDATTPLAIRIGEQARMLIELRAEVLGAYQRIIEQNSVITDAILRTHELHADTNKRLIELASRDGVISGENADRIRDKVKDIVMLRARLSSLHPSDRKGEAAIRADIYGDLFGYLNWGRKGQSIASMPAEKWPLARAYLDYQMRKLRGGKRGKRPAGASIHASGPQVDLFGDKGSNKPN